MLIIRLIYFHQGPSPEDLVNKVEKNLKTKNIDQEPNIKFSSNTSNTSDTINKDEDDTNLDANNSKNSFTIKSFRHLVDLFYQKKEGMLHTYLYNNVKLISFKEGEIVINDDSIKDPNFKRTIAKYISKWTGRIWQVIPSNSNIGKTLYEEDLINQQKQIELMKNNNEIKQILDKFPKAKIYSITDISETSKENIIEDKINIKKEK